MQIRRDSIPTEDDIEEIKVLHKNGVTMQDLSRNVLDFFKKYIFNSER